SGNDSRPFEVTGSTFVNFAAAATRTCDNKFNACVHAANGGAAGIAVPNCSTQKATCQA
ncbi:hypothetical protein HOY82DRAFT_467222, partial [Tuber indicum]